MIYKLNNFSNKIIKFDEEGVKLFEGVKKVYELLGYKYDIIIVLFLELWGFIDEIIEFLDLKFLIKEEIEFIKIFIGFDKVKIFDDGIFIMGSLVREIDIGFFLKGYVILRVKEVLKNEGIKSVFIILILSIDLIGIKLDNKFWKIGL